MVLQGLGVVILEGCTGLPLVVQIKIDIVLTIQRDSSCTTDCLGVRQHLHVVEQICSNIMSGLGSDECHQY